MIKHIIDALESATSLPVKALYTETTGECIVYNSYSTLDDGAKSIHRLELRLITKSYANAEEYRKKIINALIPIGDNIKTEDVLGIALNGGGCLYEGETKTIHTLLYFDIVSKSEN